MKVDVHGLRDDQVIRRFVELPKLFELIAAGRSFFPTIATLRAIDPFECAIALPQAARKLGRRALASEAMSLLQHLPEEYSCGDRVEDYKRHERVVKHANTDELRQHVREMRLILMQSRVVCNCWHAEERESDAMWKLYAGNIGVMLVSTVGKLRSAIRGSYANIFCSPNPQEYVIAPIRYIDEASLRRLPLFYVDRPWLLKRSSFAYEREVRIFHQVPWVINAWGGGMAILIDPSKLISEVVLSPSNPAWADAPISAAINALLKEQGLSLPIRKSDHMRRPIPESAVLANLSILKMRDSLGGGGRLRMESREERHRIDLSTVQPLRAGKRTRTKSKR
jgi:hypothetical protein